MADAALKQSATEARLAGLNLPTGGFAEAARREALSRVTAMGLPERRDEYWKYTRPDTLVQAAPVPAALFEHDEAPLFDSIDRLNIVFVDGVFDAEASDDPELAGIVDAG